MTSSSSVPAFRVARSVCIAAAVMLTMPMLARSAPRDGEALLDCVRMLERGEAASALIGADEHIARYGPTPLAITIKGAAQLSMYQTGDARDSLGAALALDVSYDPALMGMAVCAVRDGAFDDAAEIYRRIIASHDSPPVAVRSGLALALMAGGDTQAALDEIELIRRTGTPDALACHVEALALMEAGDDQRALAALRRGTTLLQQRPLAPVMTPMVVCAPEVMAPSQQAIASARESTAYLALLSQDTSQAHPETVPVPALPRGDIEFGIHGAPGPAKATPPRLDVRPPVRAVEREAIPQVVPKPSRRAGFAVVSPTSGQTVSGLVEVVVSIPKGQSVDYVTLSVDGAFRSMSNLPPFRLSFDTRSLQDGEHRLRVEAHSRAGETVDSASVAVAVDNVQRTTTPRERRARAEARERLVAFLALRPHPLDRTFLAGRVAERMGRLADAVAAYEYVFSTQPLYPGAHASLVSAYARLGILHDGNGALEVRRIPTDGRPGAGRGEGKRVALTFDDGPNPSLTPSILDDLDEVGAKATFFLVGKQAELYPELVREIHDRGHDVACHSYSHVNQSHLSTVEIERELIKTRAIIREVTGESVVYFRPPGGRYDDDVRRAVGEMGYTTVWWTAAITQYAGQPPDVVLRRMLADIKPGGIVLLHNGYDETVPVLRPLLRELKKRGYEMVTLSEALGRSHR